MLYEYELYAANPVVTTDAIKCRVFSGGAKTVGLCGPCDFGEYTAGARMGVCLLVPACVVLGKEWAYATVDVPALSASLSVCARYTHPVT